MPTDRRIITFNYTRFKRGHVAPCGGGGLMGNERRCVVCGATSDLADTAASGAERVRMGDLTDWEPYCATCFDARKSAFDAKAGEMRTDPRKQHTQDRRRQRPQ